MLAAISKFLLELLYFFIDLLYNYMIEVINSFIFVLSTFITSLIYLFPPNPCGSLIASCADATSGLTAPDSGLYAQVCNAIAWLIPWGYLINLVGCVMMSIMIYFAVAPLMRWAKLST